MPFSVKRDVIEGLGVDELVVIPFDRDFASIDPVEFIERILIEPARRDARLGRRELPLRRPREGHSGACSRARPEFETSVVPLVEVGGETVSSTRIRALVSAGEVEEAAECLGAPFMVEGTVVSGDRRGRTLGFPTANLVPDDALVCPGHGVYAAFANGRPAAVNVGVRPTFESGRGVLIETYIIDHDEDLYGKTLRVAFAKRLRGEKRFDGAEALVAQMNRDVEEAREVLRLLRDLTLTQPASSSAKDAIALITRS